MYYNENVLYEANTKGTDRLALRLTSLRKHECAIYYAFKAEE